MVELKDELIRGSVVIGPKKPFYDDPNIDITGRKSIYVVVKKERDFFLGCPLTSGKSKKCQTRLKTCDYPIKTESKINPCIYKVEYTEVIGRQKFKLTRDTLKHFERELYKKIVLGYIESPSEYNELFAEDWLERNRPTVGNIIVYPSSDKEFKHFYIYGEDHEHYDLLKVNKLGHDNFELDNLSMIYMPKSIRFFDFYTNHNITYDIIRENLGEVVKQKKLGSIYNTKK